jgi:hypothetical protein
VRSYGVDRGNGRQVCRESRWLSGCSGAIRLHRSHFHHADSDARDIAVALYIASRRTETVERSRCRSLGIVKVWPGYPLSTGRYSRAMGDCLVAANVRGEGRYVCSAKRSETRYRECDTNVESHWENLCLRAGRCNRDTGYTMHVEAFLTFAHMRYI